MKGILADVNFQGHLGRLTFIMHGPAWLDLWTSLGLKIVTFHDLGLHPKTRDRIVWNRCQVERLVLLTDNRNDDGPDSLEAAIRDGPPDALPVFTIGDSQRVLEDDGYARLVVNDLMDYLDDLVARPEALLGAGRLYLPKEAQKDAN